MSTPAIAPVERHRPGPAARTAARLGGRVPVLDTRRLQLRGPRIYDFAAFAEIMTTDRAIFMGGPFTRAEAWGEFTQYTAQWMLHGHGLWTIDAQTAPSAGFVTLGFEYDDPEPELGIFLTAAAEGQGYAEEALRAVRAHAFEALDWDNVASFVAEDNDRCIRLMERLGATRDSAAEAALDAPGTLVFRHVKETA
ncbi:GNAT family N-acetyltransferase [Pseudoponticoccus marisrubri]|uniref:GNAT family acetyltransferase n=1 Tax=Pseudoponticoccus marisrubri TaxID=1685382 RepID=A0A0W7WG44_9RHOB|nr:GNAT family N-acetyltransferase [Pseudoponticoccus marisrubri]KUF09454.1 GNAT family acetyltransferase [Pseudoponticoccus marisrubri]